MTLFSKKNILVGAGALGILATSISLFMRETVNFAKMEGDSKPAAIVKAEERVIKDSPTATAIRDRGDAIPTRSIPFQSLLPADAVQKREGA